MQSDSSPTDDDLFEGIVSKQDITLKTSAAIRISMLARGSTDGFEGSIWPLTRCTHQNETIQQAVKDRYGKQGVLEKESPSFFGGWSQRYVVLRGQKLIYKQNASPVSPNAGIINFNLVSCEVAIELRVNVVENFRILVKNGEKEFIFRGINSQQTEEWYAAVVQAMQQSDGWGKNLSYLAKYSRFWRKDYEGQAEFRRTVQPGDILLFRGMKDSSIMQRVVTRDEYDHVAMVLLNQLGEPLVFEANGGFGVGICPWLKFIEKGWWRDYQIVVHRRLKMTRTDKFLDIMQTFVQANMGKHYDFSLTSYLFDRTSSKEKEHQHYFCSSLVAKLYKKLGLIASKKSCKQYLPSSFAAKDNLQLSSDGPFGYAFLSQEKIIVFEGMEGKK